MCAGDAIYLSAQEQKLTLLQSKKVRKRNTCRRRHFTHSCMRERGFDCATFIVPRKLYCVNYMKKVDPHEMRIGIVKKSGNTCTH